MTTLYNFDPVTNEHISETEARNDPKDKTPMVPNFSTLVKPPRTAKNEAAVWNEDAWTIQPDFRGFEYWLDDGSYIKIKTIGAKPPENALKSKPEPTLEELKASARNAAENIAKKIRLNIANNASTERVAGWLLKTIFALSWAEYDDTSKKTEALRTLADVAKRGFELEGNITKEDPKKLRSRTIKSAGGLFLAQQIVEAIERTAEIDIAKASSKNELKATIKNLQSMQNDAQAQLEKFTKKGDENNA